MPVPLMGQVAEIKLHPYVVAGLIITNNPKALAPVNAHCPLPIAGTQSDLLITSRLGPTDYALTKLATNSLALRLRHN